MSLTPPADISMSAGSSSGLEQRFALDVQSIGALRRTAGLSPQEGLKQVSRQFEAIFMQMILKSMRDAAPAEGMFQSQQERLYTSMLDQQLAQHLSGKGLGLAEVLRAQLSRSLDVGAAQHQDALPQPESPSLAPQPGVNPVSAEPTPVDSPDLSSYDIPSGRSDPTVGAAAPHIDQFVARIAAPARAASRASGVPVQLIVAQAALESGWGRREIRADDGTPSYNLFGIKAGKAWKGPVVETATTEYVAGIPRRTTGAFRLYRSYDEAFADYARLLVGNPRYAHVLHARDPAEAAYGLQRAGYATDPGYGDKLVRIMKQIV